MPAPTIGRIVQVLVDPATNAGEDIAPAIITKVHSEDTIDVRLFTNSAHSATVDSIQNLPLYATQGEAEQVRSEIHDAHQATHSGEPANLKHLNLAFWPNTAPADEAPAARGGKGKGKETPETPGAGA